jgi:hypothetical protein
MCLLSLFPYPILLIFCLLPKSPLPPSPVPDMVYLLPDPSHPNGPYLVPPIQNMFQSTYEAPPAKDLCKNEIAPRLSAPGSVFVPAERSYGARGR